MRGWMIINGLLSICGLAAITSGDSISASGAAFSATSCLLLSLSTLSAVVRGRA